MLKKIKIYDRLMSVGVYVQGCTFGEGVLQSPFLNTILYTGKQILIFIIYLIHKSVRLNKKVLLKFIKPINLKCTLFFSVFINIG